MLFGFFSSAGRKKLLGIFLKPVRFELKSLVFSVFLMFIEAT